jgi:dimethylamine monooxygenase subunit A
MMRRIVPDVCVEGIPDRLASRLSASKAPLEHGRTAGRSRIVFRGSRLDRRRAGRTRLLVDPGSGNLLGALAEATPALAETVAIARKIGASIEIDATASDQLLALGRTWETDFVWMHPTEGGRHQLIGGVVCFPSKWALRDKIGRTMAEVHSPVPELNAALAEPIERFMSRQRPGDVWIRENVNFARDRNLNHHPAQPHPPIDPTIRPEEFFLRFEHQLLLKLPASGSILFGIRIEAIPLADVLSDAVGAERLACILKSMSDAAAYKGIASARDVLVAFCRSAQKS